ncbi:MAG: nucleoid-associated protein [Marinifilaceae bacterium]
MYDFSKAKIDSIIVHNVGNKYEDEKLDLSMKALDIADESINQVLFNYFFSPFKKDELYNFNHEQSLDKNIVYNFVQDIFENNLSFYENSVNIAKQLFLKSNHPNIKSGEFYVVFLKDCVFYDEVCDAIGLFKSESKETFLKVFLTGDTYQLGCEDGINIKKLDKGCVIFNTSKEQGYNVCIVDKTNKNNDTVYWRDDFLGLKAVEASYFNTKNYLDLCKDFVKDVYNQDNEVSLPDQIDLLNRSINYFKDTDVFSENEFKDKIITEPDVIEAFEDYKQFYSTEKDLDIKDVFGVSESAVKDSKRYFKHVLKLDKNFHIYIHGNRKFVEKGFDTAKDMNYYKLFYKEEK